MTTTTNRASASRRMAYIDRTRYYFYMANEAMRCKDWKEYDNMLNAKIEADQMIQMEEEGKDTSELGLLLAARMGDGDLALVIKNSTN